MENEILILADPNGKAWNFSQKIYEKLNSNPRREHRYLLREVEIKHFNDGEIFVKILDNVREKPVFFIHDSSMNPQDWMVSLMEVNDALMRSNAGKITNILPYIKYSRQDRLTEPRVPLTSSILAKAISLEANRVITTDLHNPAIAGAYDIPFDNLKAYPTIINYIRENYPEIAEDIVVVAPDVGGAEMAKSYAKRLGGKVAIATKSREKAGVVEEMTIIGDIKDKNVLVVDDMIDTAGTLCKAAKVLKENGAQRIWACATHGLFSKDAVEKLSCSDFEKVIITDSIHNENRGKIEVVSLKNLFAEAIFRISHGESLSELFL